MHPRLLVADLQEHPLRQRLNNEFHARPSTSLAGPYLVSHLVFKHKPSEIEAERANLEKICQSQTCLTVDSSDAHLSLETAAFRLRWELHTEFSSYTFYRKLDNGVTAAADDTAFDALRPELLHDIPGKLVVACHVELRSTRDTHPDSILAGIAPNGRTLGGAQIADQAAWVFTDFKLDNGFSRILVLNDSLNPRQAGATVQRLVEIETYRMMALLGLPVAKEVSGWLYRCEQQLAELMTRIGQARSPEDERSVLAALTQLAAEVENSLARATFRFGASAAYHGMVRQRIQELRESRVPGLPTLDEFMQRRLLPAMKTCEAISRRQEELSARIARNSQLLRTRVDIELERQNQELLSQMNQRAKLQLRLQETVEGLSVVVLTYYGSQLVHYLAKGTKWLHHLDSDLITACAIPVIALLVAWGSRSLRRRLHVNTE